MELENLNLELLDGIRGARPLAIWLKLQRLKEQVARGVSFPEALFDSQHELKAEDDKLATKIEELTDRRDTNPDSILQCDAKVDELQRRRSAIARALTNIASRINEGAASHDALEREVRLCRQQLNEFRVNPNVKPPDDPLERAGDEADICVLNFVFAEQALDHCPKYLREGRQAKADAAKGQLINAIEAELRYREVKGDSREL